MRVNNIVIIVVFLIAITCKTTLNAQVELGLFSYSEFFYSPSQSYGDLKSFYDGNNKSNYSSHLGMFIDYKINRQFSISVGLQRINRQFDCDCVNVFISKSNFYYVSDDVCVLQSKSKDKILQMPLSVRYLFPSKNKNITHSLGIGNTIIYSLGRESFLYDNTGSLNLTFGRKFISFLSPEIYYQLDASLSKRVSANLSFGIREEITKQVNHAFFGKLGLGYAFGKMPKIKQKRK